MHIQIAFIHICKSRIHININMCVRNVSSYTINYLPLLLLPTFCNMYLFIHSKNFHQLQAKADTSLCGSLINFHK